jgi:hypothetical protein
MSHKHTLSISRYEIVKYNLQTRKDIEVLPGEVQGLREVNHKIKTLNALMEADKNNQNGEIIYYRRRIGGK